MPAEPATTRDRTLPHSLLLCALAVIVFVAAAFGPDLRLPFVGDDYVFVSRTLHAKFSELWSFHNTTFRWYRPWSRELYFWSILKIAGPSPLAFRICNLALWLVGLWMYFDLIRRFTGRRAALLATAGVLGLSLWGTPLLWISGSQDLWLVFWSLIALRLWVTGRWLLALLPYTLALLSKETAAILPIILIAHCLLYDPRRILGTVRRVLPAILVTIAWVAVHPTLHERLLHGDVSNPELAHRPALFLICAKTLLSLVNCQLLPEPRELDPVVLLRWGLTVLALGFFALSALRSGPSDRFANESQKTRIAFFLTWTVAGWIPLFLPSIGWHAYYGCLGALGAWALIGEWLASRPSVAMSAVLALGMLRGAQATTLTWDWGNEWYQRRAGFLLEQIRASLYEAHPTLPPHARVYFSHIPNNIGLVAGDSPAIGVWYGDPSIFSGWYSSYRRGDPSTDYFFTYDSLRGLREVVPVRRAPDAQTPRDPPWAKEHLDLAVVYLEAGDYDAAGSEFARLGAELGDPNMLVYAGTCYELSGRTATSDSLLDHAAHALSIPRDSVDAVADRLRSSLPTPPR